MFPTKVFVQTTQSLRHDTYLQQGHCLIQVSSGSWPLPQPPFTLCQHGQGMCLQRSCWQRGISEHKMVVGDMSQRMVSEDRQA